MSFSSNTYTLPSSNPVVTGTVISSSWANTTLTDIGTALSTCVLKDGTQTLTANIPMSSFKLTGLAAGGASGDSVRYEQVLLLAGGTMAGNIAMGSHKLTGLAAGSSAGDSVRYEQLSPVTGVGRNIAGKTNATHPTYQIDITADELVVKDTSGNALILSSVSVTADITASGANGLDTGSEASSTWYYGYVIAKSDGTTASLLSTSATAPTMPATYTYKALVSAVYNDSSSNFIPYRQFGRNAFYESQQPTSVFSNTVTSETSYSLANVIPSVATELMFTLTMACTADGSGVVNVQPHIRIVSGSDFYSVSWAFQGLGASVVAQPPAVMGVLPNISQTVYVYWDNTTGSGNMSMYARGFALPGGGQ